MIPDNGPQFPPFSSFVCSLPFRFLLVPFHPLRVGLEDSTLESCPIDEKPRFEQGKTQKKPIKVLAVRSKSRVKTFKGFDKQCLCHV